MKYTAQEWDAMRRAYPDASFPGHVTRLDADGTFTIVPEQQSAGAFGRGQALNTVYKSPRPIREDFPVAPIKRRTPQERTESMMQNLLQEWQKTGTIPGLSEEKVSELVVRSWTRGQPLSADDVRRAAANLLAEAERKDNAAQAKKVVRRSPTD